MTLEEFDRAITDIPKTKTNEAISAYGSINLDHLRDVVERFRKVPTYDELLKENQKYKEVIDKAIELLGNYKQYSTPDEQQNSDNEDLVNKAFNILKEVK